MKSEVAKLLKPIVKALNKEDAVASDLWDILTALRGPDDETACGILKFETTSRLRYASGMRHAASKPGRQCPVDYWLNGKAELSSVALPTYEDFIKACKTYGHFYVHFKNALEAMEKS